jgi:type I restriction enzyme S subunit
VGLPDDLIDNNNGRIALLEEAVQRLYREWFVHLRFPGHEQTRIIDGVPEGWQKDKLNDVAVVNRHTLPSSYDGVIEYVDIASVVPGRITKTTSYHFKDAPGRAKRVVQHGDLIWSCVRPNRKSYAVIWNPNDNLIVSTGFAVITPVDVPSTFLYFATTTPEFVGYLENRAKGAAYPAVTASDFEQALLPHPSRHLLDAFNKIAEPVFAQIHNLGLQNTRLAEARDALLPRLMNGSLAV